MNHGRTYRVDQPQVIPMAEATGYFGQKEQRLHRRFAVATCLPGPSHDGVVTRPGGTGTSSSSGPQPPFRSDSSSGHPLSR